MIAIIPVKPFAAAKERLATVLSRSEREALAHILLHQTLDIVKSCDAVDKIEVITADRDAEKTALSHGCNVVREDFERGLNPALEQGVSAIHADSDTKILILPTDLPYLQCDDIMALSSGEGPAIAPDAKGTGTNGLFFAMRDRPAFRFGENSAIRHGDSFQNMGQAPMRIIKRPGLSFDLDTPEDLARLSNSPQAGKITTVFEKMAKAA